MARRLGTTVRRASTDARTGRHPRPSPEVGPFVALAVLAVPAGFGLHYAWGRTLPDAAVAASAVSLATVGLFTLTAVHARPRPTVQRWQAAGSVGVSGAVLLLLLIVGWSWSALSVAGFAVAVNTAAWLLFRSNVVRGDGTDEQEAGEDRTAVALGIEGAKARKVHEDDDKVVTKIRPALGQSHKDVQKIAEPLATATHAPVGGVRVPVNPADAGDITVVRMKRDVLHDTILWPGPSNLGGTFADPLEVGRREDGTVARLWFPGRHTRSGTHLLIMGMSGSGKGESFRVTAAEIMTRRDVLFWLIDYAKPWQTARGIVGGLDLFATSKADAGQVIAHLRKFIPYRSRKLGQAGWDQWDEDCPVPAIVVWIEEAAELFAADEQWVEHLPRLAEQCRSVGVFLVYSIQRAHSANMDTNVRAQLGAGWCFGVDGGRDAEFCLSPVTLAAGADPSWGNKRVGYAYLEAPGIDEQDWSQKMRGYLAKHEQLVETVASATDIRCPGLPPDEAAFWGDIYTRLHTIQSNPSEALVPIEDLADEDGYDDTIVPVDPELKDEIDPSEPILPYDPARDGPDIEFPELVFDPKELTAEEVRDEFDKMLRKLAEEGITTVNTVLLMERWPYRKRPWISKQMKRLEKAGQVERYQERPFAEAEWRLVALVSAAQ